MKKFIKFSAIIAAVCAAVTLSACGSLSDDPPVLSGETPEVQTTPDTFENGTPEKEEGKVPDIKPAESESKLLPISALDEVNVAAAFGADGDEWEFSLSALGDLSADYNLSYYSKITDDKKSETLMSADLYVKDTLGIKSDADSVLGFDLFGDGAIGLNFGYTGPLSGGKPASKNFEAGITHDADWFYVKSGDNAGEKYSKSEVETEIRKAMQLKMISGFAEAVYAIPESLQNGFGLRLGVEKLIDLGFKVEITDESGLCVRISANKGFFTDLINDVLYGFLPESWLDYIPRFDVRYTSRVFDLTLAFDESGLFREFSLSSDVKVDLEYDGIFFYSRGALTLGGSASVTSAPSA